jgi:hypothetical protein
MSRGAGQVVMAKKKLIASKKKQKKSGNAKKGYTRHNLLSSR